MLPYLVLLSVMASAASKDNSTYAELKEIQEFIKFSVEGNETNEILRYIFLLKEEENRKMILKDLVDCYFHETDKIITFTKNLFNATENTQVHCIVQNMSLLLLSTWHQIERKECLLRVDGNFSVKITSLLKVSAWFNRLMRYYWGNCSRPNKRTLIPVLVLSIEQQVTNLMREKISVFMTDKVKRKDDPEFMKVLVTIYEYGAGLLRQILNTLSDDSIRNIDINISDQFIRFSTSAPMTVFMLHYCLDRLNAIYQGKEKDILKFEQIYVKARLYSSIALYAYEMHRDGHEDATNLMAKLPRGFQNIFGNTVCLKNAATKQYLKNGRQEDSYRREVYLASDNATLWEAYVSAQRYFWFQNQEEEYLFASVLKRSQDHRAVYTWIGTKPPSSRFFIIEPVGNNVRIINVDRQEFLYGGHIGDSENAVCTISNKSKENYWKINDNTLWEIYRECLEVTSKQNQLG